MANRPLLLLACAVLVAASATACDVGVQVSKPTPTPPSYRTDLPDVRNARTSLDLQGPANVSLLIEVRQDGADDGARCGIPTLFDASNNPMGTLTPVKSQAKGQVLWTYRYGFTAPAGTYVVMFANDECPGRKTAPSGSVTWTLRPAG